jgi:hypothetical protein
VHAGPLSPYVLFASTHQTEASVAGLWDLGNQRTAALGVRWDFARNIDLKAQAERVTLASLDDPASFANIQADARVGDHANVVSLALDFVF